jgi:hypothetical protein
MIPAITPPTDNLYKFVSLFGLTIFLFAVYNLGIVYDRVSEDTMQIEDIKVEIQKELYKASQPIIKALTIDSVGVKFRPTKIKKLNEDLHKIEDAIEQSALAPETKIELAGKVSKLSVGVDALKLKQWCCIGFMVFGLGVMIYGFLRWHTKEQKLRDSILSLEHKMKERRQKKVVSKEENI